ncbi:hypothetical protein GF325_02090 [Candidatus Bathyarchaeota archaeon]|nr:hypothetical protein [Candidatus Bathyarchaeota archaeon]
MTILLHSSFSWLKTFLLLIPPTWETVGKSMDPPDGRKSGSLEKNIIPDKERV